MKKIIFLFFPILVNKCFSQSDNFLAAQDLARTFISSSGIKHDPKRNIYFSLDRTIHIFIFEDGNLLLGGYPTTATEIDKFQVHLFVRNTNSDDYLFEYSGIYSPVLNIEYKGSSGNSLTANIFGKSISIRRIDFAVLGPFTHNLALTLKQKAHGSSNYQVLTNTTIQLSKIIHISIGSGIVFTSLKNPENIHTLTLPNGDTTLIADQTSGKALLTIMATFYPWGRSSLLLQSRKFKDHFGVVIGTSIADGSSNFKNFLLGAQYDFAPGGSIVLGGHYGKRQKIDGIKYNDFEFGKTKFTGNLDSKKYMSWDLGFFIGVQVDSRVFARLFQGQ